jgi:hypothetical protein
VERDVREKSRVRSAKELMLHSDRIPLGERQGRQSVGLHKLRREYLGRKSDPLLRFTDGGDSAGR